MNQETTSISTERRRASRYNLKSRLRVMLLRESLRPRVCYVQNFSQTGVLLVCLSSAEEAVFKIGDRVNINFRNHNLTQQSCSVSGDIVRVTADGVAVDFSAAEKSARRKFLSLLKTSANEPLPVTPQLREETAVESVTPKPPPSEDHDVEPLTSEPRHVSIDKGAAKSRLAMLVGALIVISLAFGLLGLYNYRLHSRLDETRLILDSLEKQLPPKGDREAVSDLTRRLNELERSQKQLAVALDDPPDTQALRATIEELRAELADLKQARRPPEAPVTGDNPETTSNGVKWVINLMALSDSDAAARIVARARKSEIEIKSQEIKVGNKSMHRLFIPGLASYEEASELAGRVQKELSLKEAPWIVKQK